jgi:autotransporter passenger strand-loop-strand repeat protein
VSSGGIQYDAGTASNTTLSNGGTEIVFASDTSATVESGGVQAVVAGGTAIGAAVSGGGIQYDAGTASGTMLLGGTEVVYGSAASTTIDSGGYALALSGGIIDATTINGGTLEFGSGANAGLDPIGFTGGNSAVFSNTLSNDSTVVFAGGGTVRLDQPVAYNVLVASFGVPDAFDFTDIAFASATKDYVGNTSSGTLTVSDGTNSASLLLLGNYTAASFNLGPESGGGTGTVVTDMPLTSSSVITPPHG